MSTKRNKSAQTKDFGVFFRLYDQRHLANIVRSTKAIDELYRAVVQEAARIGSSTGFNDPERPFSLNDYPQARKRFDAMIEDFTDNVEGVVLKGTETAWMLSAAKNAGMIDRLAKGTRIDKERLEQWKEPNLSALEAFQQRKLGNGMGLSDRVWKLGQQTRQELEMALDLGLGEGKSAAELSRDVRQYLQEPNKLFRRVRDKHGNLHLSKNAEAYHPGQGVYRSSYKNAIRLTATETNMAYHKADHDKWGNLGMVIGQKIQLSNNHTLNGKPFHDICDELQGDYPKDFEFTGWHPLCRCFMTPILADFEEYLDYMDAVDEGKDMSGYHFKGEVTEMPESFNNWIEENRDRIENAKSMPYFIKNNYVDGDVSKGLRWAKVDEYANTKAAALERHKNRTPEQIQDIKDRWAEYKKRTELQRKTAENIINVAEDYEYADSSKLQDLLAKNRTTDLIVETKRLAQELSSIKKWEKEISTLVPYVKKWETQFGQTDIQKVYDSVKNNLEKWKAAYANDSYIKSKYPSVEEYLKHKLEFEITHTTTVGASKYATWEVAVKSYTSQLTKVCETIKINDIKAKIPSLKAVSSGHTKKLNQLISDIEIHLANGDTALAELSLQDAEHQANYIIRSRAKKGSKGTVFSPDAYSQDRKDKALWAKDPNDGDDYFRPFAENDWKKWSQNEREVAFNYTSGSSYINEPLYTTYLSTKYGVNGEIRNSWDDINTLTDIIDKSTPFTKDVWLNRGDSRGGFLGQFGLRLSDYEGNPSALVGKEGIQAPFMSTAHTKGYGFVDDGKGINREVVYNIYCPKGTKGIYTEPYSRYGALGSDGYNWDATSGKHDLRGELEVILQRGTKLRITKAEYKMVKTSTGRNTMAWVIDMEVIEQPAKLPNVI